MAKKQKKTTTLKEPATSYKTKRGNVDTLSKATSSLRVASKKSGNSVAYWLGSENIKSIIRSDFDLISIGEEGISKASLDELAVHLGISRKSMAEDILDLSVKTLERKSPSDKLDKRTSSHAIEIAKLLQHANEVFGDEEKLRRWINKENRALNWMKPISLFATLTGLNMVNDILGRIEEGVYS